MTNFKLGDKVRLLTWEELTNRFKNSSFYRGGDVYYFKDGCGMLGVKLFTRYKDIVFTIERLVELQDYNPCAWIHGTEGNFPISLNCLVKINNKPKYINKGN